MQRNHLLGVAAVLALATSTAAAGPAEIYPLSKVRRGQTGYGMTTFVGATPERFEFEVVNIQKNFVPGLDIILVQSKDPKLATSGFWRGMSGSPVYIDGKLIGAVALRLSVFSPDAICGITPIDLMLEINEFDQTRPGGSKTPENASPRAALEVPGELLAKVVSAGSSAGSMGSFPQQPLLTPIETPLTLSGFTAQTLQEFGPLMRQMGLNPVQGGASGALKGSAPAPGWQNALQPGDPVSGVLVSGDMGMTGLGTVSYNDGKRVLAFGHPFFNLGPVNMPMAKSEVLMTLASAFQPSKIGNATEIVGALHQDRHSGIMGVLGDTAEVIPVTFKIRTFNGGDKIHKEKDFKFNVFVQQKWTPFLMMVTLFNSISGVNDFSEEVTYRVTGKVELEGQNISLTNMQAPGDLPVPPPMVLAGWWGDKFNRLFGNNVQAPKLKRVDAVVDLLPQRRVASIENAWVDKLEAEPGDTLKGRVFLRPFRGERMMREFALKIPPSMPKGEHRILLSDADTLNRMQTAAGMVNRYMDIPDTVSLINQERSNNNLYVSLVEARPTVYANDKTLPSLPASVLNVMQSGLTQNRPFLTTGESASQQTALPFDLVVNGSYSLKVTVK